MKCKYCSREVPGESIFCMYCGERVARRKREKKTEIKIPKPRQLKSGAWNIELRKEGESVTEATKEACEAKARAIRAGFLKREKALPKQSLDSLLKSYIDDSSNILSPSTVRGYESIRKTRFQSVMQTEISEISWPAVINEEAASDLSPKTLANSWRLVSAAYRHAHLPVPEVRLPQRVKSERPWLDPQQIETFLDAIRGRKCELACLLALHSLRMSEILALTQDSIQGEKQDAKILVRGAVVIDQDGQYVYKEENKTAASRRDIPVMIPRLLEIWPPEQPFQKHAAINEMVQSICEKAGLPPITMHSLRHSFASLAWFLGWDILTTCYYGGWSTPTTVQRIYTHLSQQTKNRNVDEMRAFYNCNFTNEITNDSADA